MLEQSGGKSCQATVALKLGYLNNFLPSPFYCFLYSALPFLMRSRLRIRSSFNSFYINFYTRALFLVLFLLVCGVEVVGLLLLLFFWCVLFNGVLLRQPIWPPCLWFVYASTFALRSLCATSAIAIYDYDFTSIR